MKWIGLTGSIGSGKTTVAELLKLKGFGVIDADEMAHKAVALGSPALEKLAQTFGQNILLPDGNLDRKALASRVFQNSEQLARLERIVHPRVKELVKQRRQELAAQGLKLCFYDVPLLFEKSMQSEFDAVLVVTSTDAQRLERVMKRSGWSEEEVLQRMKNQFPLTQKIAQADFVIDNSGSLSDLERQIDELIQKLK